LLKLSVAAFILCNLLEVVYVRWTHSLQGPTPRPKHQQKIFIASTHWNNEAIIRSHWTAAVLDLVRAIGVDHVYVSVYESGSWDNSKDALRILDAELGAIGVQRTIILDETTHAEEIVKTSTQSGWIGTPRGKMELRRIPYLSRLRNLSLRPLEELLESGITFDKILFLNDVVFTVGPHVTLLLIQCCLSRPD
jgi:Cryptococcal mannosyltransferase 1